MRPYDERFVVDGTEYGFLFPDRGPGGFSSVSPFPPKTVIGERSYSDYDTPSAMAWASWEGGIGQEEADDSTRYYDAYRVDGRAGPITLGPRLHHQAERCHVEVDSSYAGGPLSVNAWRPIGTDGYSKVAASFTLPDDADALYRVWVPLRATVDQGTITVHLYDSASGAPGTELANVTLSPSAVDYRGGFVEAVFDTPATGLTGGGTYWVVVEHAGLEADLGWWSLGDSSSPNELVWTGAAWELSGDAYRLELWADDPKVNVDGPPQALVGIGADNQNRVWAYHGRCLYVVNSDASLTPVKESAGGSVKILPADITDAVFFQADGATSGEIYFALGDSEDMVKFNGDLASPTWTTVSGYQATRLAVHNGMLWRVNDSIEVSGSVDGATWGNSHVVGDRMRPVLGMVSWNGQLCLGTATGVFAVSYPSGYPTTGDPVINQFLSFPELEDQRNCSLFLTHHGDLYFNLGPGIMRYTTGDVLQSIASDIGLEVDADSRAIATGGVSTISGLWVTMEGGSGQPSYLLSYVDGTWQKPFTFAVPGVMVRSVVADPGIYGELPRLWVSNALRLSYFNMPLSTQRRWLWSGVDFADSGYFTTSRFYGPLRTVKKSFRYVEIDCDNLGNYTGYPYLTISCDTGSGWVSCGTINTSPYRLELPDGTEGYHIRLLVRLYKGTISGEDATPVLRALVLRYVERPEQVVGYTRTYLLSSRGTLRNGQLRTDTLAEQIQALETLREAVSPVTWYPAWGGSRTVYVTDYQAVEQRFVSDEVGDQYDIRVTVRLQEA